MVDLQFRRAALHEALAEVGRVIPWQRDIRTPGLVRIDVADGIATITSTAFSHQMQARLACDGADVKLVAPIQSLAGIVEKAGSDIVGLTIVEGGIRFSSARTMSKMPCLDRDALPVRDPVDGDPEVVEVAAFRNGLEAALPATIMDAAKPVLGGIYIHSVGGQVVYEAQDGNRFHTAAQDGNRFHTAVVIPRDAARLILAMLPDGGSASITVGPRSLVVEAGDLRYETQLLDGGYPTGKPAPGVDSPREFRCHASTLLNDLELVAVVADEKLRDIQLDLGPQCEASAFRRDGAHPGRGAVRLIGEFIGPPLTLGVQLHLARDALRLFGDNDIVWRMNGPMEATTITSASCPGIQAVVSPCRPAADLERLAA